MIDIFSLLLGTVAVFVVGVTITKTVFAPPKVWDPHEWMLEEIEEGKDYDEIRKENPHILRWFNFSREKTLCKMRG
jgi:hypothetical protein